METQRQTVLSSFVYHRLPTTVSRQDFNRPLAPPLKRPKTGPPPTRSLSKIFHSLLSVLPTGIPWAQRNTTRHALHDTTVSQGHHRWSQEGS